MWTKNKTQGQTFVRVINMNPNEVFSPHIFLFVVSLSAEHTL